MLCALSLAVGVAVAGCATGSSGEGAKPPPSDLRAAVSPSPTPLTLPSALPARIGQIFLAAARASATPKVTPRPRTAAVAPPVAVPARSSAKKGASTWQFNGVDAALADAKVSWFYTWSADNAGIGAPGVEFVPMIWGANSVNASTLAQAKREGSTLLGFNEPDFTNQANMSPQQALDLWPQLMATGMRLGSPVPAKDADVAGSWLDQFMQGAKQRGYRVDFIALHWYGGDFSSAAVGQLQSYIQRTYNRYHLPIWLTEYALTDFSGGSPRYPSQAQQAAFVTASTAMLQSLPYVERYAWFSLPTAKESTNTGLYGDGAVPTQVGTAYRAAG